MKNTRVSWINVLLCGTFVHLFFLSTSETKALKTTPTTQTTATDTTTTVDTTAQETSSLPTDTSAITSTTGSTLISPTNSITPPLTTTVLGTTTTVPIVPPFVSGAENVSTNSFQTTTPNNATSGPLPTTAYPDIFANRQPAYYDVYQPYNTNNGNGAYNTNNGNGAIVNAVPVPQDNQQVMVVGKPVVIVRMVPAQAQPNNGAYNDGNTYSNLGQQQSQVVVQQEPGYEYDYYQLNPNGNGCPDTNQGFQYQNQGPQYPNQGYQYTNQGPQYPNPGPQYPNQGPQIPNQGPQYPNQGPQYPNQGPQIPNQGPQYPNQGLQNPNQGPQYPPNTGIQEPDYSNAEWGVPLPVPNMTLTEPDAQIVQQNVTTNVPSP